MRYCVHVCFLVNIVIIVEHALGGQLIRTSEFFLFLPLFFIFSICPVTFFEEQQINSRGVTSTPCSLFIIFIIFFYSICFKSPLILLNIIYKPKLTLLTKKVNTSLLLETKWTVIGESGIHWYCINQDSLQAFAELPFSKFAFSWPYPSFKFESYINM